MMRYAAMSVIMQFASSYIYTCIYMYICVCMCVFLLMRCR